MSVVNLSGSGASASSGSGRLTVRPSIAQPILKTVLERFDGGEGFTSVWKYDAGLGWDWHGYFDRDSEG